MKIESDKPVILVLQNPREKVLGILREISAAGITVRGIDLNYFDEWTSAINSGEPYLPMQECFYPMWRVERLSADTGNSDVVAMSEQFKQRTGRHLAEF